MPNKVKQAKAESIRGSASGTESSQGTAATSQRNSFKNLVKTLLKVAFAVGLISWMIHKGALDFGVFAKIATPSLIALCAAMIFLQLFINNYRWLILMRGQGLRSSVGYTLPLTFIGLFFNFVMPGGVGGDVLKGYYLVLDHPRQKFASAVSIFMDRLVGFFVMIATAFIALFFNWEAVSRSQELRSVSLATGALFCCFVVFFALALSRRLGRVVFEGGLGRLVFEKIPGGGHLRRFYDQVHAYRSDPKAFFIATFLSGLTQIPSVGFVYLVATSMGVTDIPLSVYFFLVPVGTVVTALPISPAGIGVGQAAFYFLFSLYLGKSSQLGPTAITLMQVLNFCWGLVGAYFYLHRKKPVVPVEG